MAEFRVKRGQLYAFWAHVNNQGEKKLPWDGGEWEVLAFDSIGNRQSAKSGSRNCQIRNPSGKGVFCILEQCGHPEDPPPTILDGWVGIDDAMIIVYCCVPENSGRRRPTNRKKLGNYWMYLWMVKQRNEYGRIQGRSRGWFLARKPKWLRYWKKGRHTLNAAIWPVVCSIVVRCVKPWPFPKVSRLTSLWPSWRKATKTWSAFTRACGYPIMIAYPNNGRLVRRQWLPIWPIIFGLLMSCWPLYPYQVLPTPKRETAQKSVKLNKIPTKGLISLSLKVGRRLFVYAEFLCLVNFFCQRTCNYPLGLILGINNRISMHLLDKSKPAPSWAGAIWVQLH